MSRAQTAGAASGSTFVPLSEAGNADRQADHSGANADSGALVIHVLVVDDEPSLREILVSLLKHEGYRVTDVATGSEALQAVKKADVHMVLTDLKLPDMDGITLLEQLLDLNPNITGIVMTGYGTIDLAVRAIRAGAAEFLTKPFQPDVVLLTIRRQFEILRLRRENAVLKHAVVKSGGIRVRAFEPDELDPKAPGGLARPKAEYERGLADGERRAAAARAQEHALMANAVRELDRTTRAQVDRIEAQATALAFEIACKVVHEAAREKQEVVQTQVRDAVARAKVRDHEQGLVRVVVNPGDTAHLEGVRQELATAAEGPVNVTIDGDPSISPGGCRVETMTRVIDATLEAQLARLGEALKRRSVRGPQ